MPVLLFKSGADNAHKWLSEMSRRLEGRIPDRKQRTELLKTVQYEATRAGLDPQLVLGVMQVVLFLRQIYRHLCLLERDFS